MDDDHAQNNEKSAAAVPEIERITATISNYELEFAQRLTTNKLMLSLYKEQQERYFSKIEQRKIWVIEELDASLQSMEQKAQQALACPCVAELRDGPCGKEFSSAFVCFIKSETPEQGSDCVEPFMKMQACMLENPDSFAKADDPLTEVRKKQWNPPKVPDHKIRLPLWYVNQAIAKPKPTDSQ